MVKVAVVIYSSALINEATGKDLSNYGIDRYTASLHHVSVPRRPACTNLGL